MRVLFRPPLESNETRYSPAQGACPLRVTISVFVACEGCLEGVGDRLCSPDWQGRLARFCSGSHLRVPSSSPSVSLRLGDLHGPVIALPCAQGVAQQFLNFLPLPQGQ